MDTSFLLQNKKTSKRKENEVMLRHEIKKHNMETTIKAYAFGMLIEVRPEFAWNLVDLYDNNIATPGYLEPDYGRLRC